MEQENIKVLLAEDDPNLGQILQSYLKAKGFPTRLCVNGKEALETFHKEVYDFCILDVMMPVKDGFRVAEEIRKTNNTIPILFLTAKSMQEDKLKGFEVGGDDYLTKPFSMEELLARISAILRRVEKKDDNATFYQIGNYTFDYNLHLLKFGEKEQKLTSREADLLKLLCNHKNEVLDRSYALKKIWLDDSYFNARSMDVYIAKLRKYLKEDESVQLMNVHGIGFKLVSRK
ncbi:MAG: response regulator transcription factor [Bacteroidales bacterium]|nr:response regulator transcription factor [Bacteroidales bacterium]MDD2322293.1 response regulator transcription factor [Bacteroidales bacterium]MDD3010761.1 response regulator transcription factor [Bacteroidales bacterium]MDD3961261.1 response regulator transcription factor [Bacteroidales bacterium]MDY0286576.1 response regulator transcription factor [Bacteroidales bacterium]